MPIQIRCLEPEHLEAFLMRRRAEEHLDVDTSLSDHLVAILRKANEFVPSRGGSILLDNPTRKRDLRDNNELTFIAAFGKRSEALLGRVVTANRGIAGHVYLTAEGYVSSQTEHDRHFWPGVDRQVDFQTASVLAVPIRIEREVCGVLELVNRVGAKGFDERDRDLLEIFAGYISVSIQNVLDARFAQGIARRDNLTGLLNDRWLHVVLDASIQECRGSGRDLAVLFLDLDYFKRVNDTHGHLAGSQVLHEVGQLLRDLLQGRGGHIARYGGDEFVVVLPGFELAAAAEVAEIIRRTVERTVFISKPGEIQQEALSLRGLTCSIGLATLGRHVAEDRQEIPDVKAALLRLADTAMYISKETGRNRTSTAGEPVPRND